ncbi:HicB family protein [Candidatus Glomeribacter gigasporarum BEG34]|uniref:HicB family protein n=1 Tax=Candidatus Glomeribacter gigasporarum BEG34 TaxID=1070319 RepID=G2JBR9_9BURK|nr:type II toxin-antitoxin system HicB family antitoxin [Candidatus Glomeribacter gigasporarum]CCD30224.1 HicB family protein [Candidatus Glomeribacter gigasporarum BEG34]
MKPMTYKGYSARIEYSDEDDCFIGRLAGIRDIITFHGNFVEEVRHAFQEAVDFYLETCRQRNEAPQKPYSGKISLRISPNIHARMAMQADAAGKSINQWVAETLEHAIHA